MRTSNSNYSRADIATSSRSQLTCQLKSWNVEPKTVCGKRFREERLPAHSTEAPEVQIQLRNGEWVDVFDYTDGHYAFDMEQWAAPMKAARIGLNLTIEEVYHDVC